VTELIEPEPVRMQHGLKLKEGPIAPSPLNPRLDDVIQGDIAACPIAAVMIALANARPANLGRILGARQPGPVLSKRRDEEIFGYWSDHFYDVTFPGRRTATRITPYVYFAGQQVQYASMPGGAGWPSYIEKAYAVWKSHGGQGGSGGDYSRIAQRMSVTDPPDLTEVMRDLIGPTDVLDFSQRLFIEPDGSARAIRDDDVQKMASRAGARPTVAPSNPAGAEDVHAALVSNHGFAILGWSNGVRLRNPWGATSPVNPSPVVTVAQFRRAFQGIWQAR
jgi:hypothetical protein